MLPIPPPTFIFSPVTKSERPLAKNRATPAITCAVPMRPSGTSFAANERTKRLLGRALMGLLTLHDLPFEQLTINEISEHALVHRTTFYKHFEDKYHLFEYVYRTFSTTKELSD